MGGAKVRDLVRAELAPLQVRASLTNAVIGLLPDYAFSRTRTHLLRSAGWDIGRTSMFYGVPTISGVGDIHSRLRIGDLTFINVGCALELNARIDIGDQVAIGHDVRFLTSTHKVGGSGRRAGALVASPISVESGAWIGSGAIILPGVTIGAGAIVAAGSVVNRNVAPNSLVSGAPASVTVKRLPA